MKILVTGAAGFIGFHLVRQILDRGDTVVGLDNINDYYDPTLKYSRLSINGIDQNRIRDKELIKSNIFSNYKFVQADIEDKEYLFKLFKEEKFDSVINLAAQAGVRYSITNPDSYISSNIIGFYNLLEACRNFPVQHLVFASSSSVYGTNSKTPFSTSDKVDCPISLYAASKKSNELMAHTYSHLFNIPTTGLRFFTVYGPWGRPDMAYYLFVDSILNDKPIKVYNYGNMSRDFTYIDDIIEGILCVLDTPPMKLNGNSDNNNFSSPPYKIYNIGNSKPVALMEFIKCIEKELGKKALKELLPIQSGDVYSTWADVSSLMNDTTYNPKTEINQGVPQFVKWYLEYNSQEK